MQRIFLTILTLSIFAQVVLGQKNDYADKQLAAALFERNDMAVSAYYRKNLVRGDSAGLPDYASAQYRLHEYKKSYELYQMAYEKNKISTPKHASEFIQLARVYNSANADSIASKYKNILIAAGYKSVAPAKSNFRYAVATAECFNSDADDFGVSVLGNTIMYASTKDKQEKNVENSIVKTYQLNDKSSCTPEEVRSQNELFALIGTFNDKLHYGPVNIAKDKSKIFISANQEKRDEKGNYHMTILESHRDKAEKTGYSQLKSIPAASIEYSVQHPYYDDRSGYLYFSSNMPGGSGGYDLYKVKFDGEAWGKPENITEANTSSTEAFPFIDPYGNLYYAARPANGLGGLDILRIENGKNIPVLLEEPINSPYDDFGLMITDTKHGYFSSNRPSEKKGDNIYSYKIVLPPYKLTIKVRDQDSLNVLKGVSIENKFQQAIYRLPMKYPDTTFVAMSDDSGEFTMTFPGDLEATSWTANLSMVKAGYIKRPTTANVTFGEERNMVVEKVIKKEEVIELPKVVEEVKKVTPRIRVGVDLGKLLNLNPIYFDVGKAEIRADAALELDKIVVAMTELPNLTIELGAHTDSRGQAKDNLKLSQLRAESSGKYILSKGIDPRRLSWNGYGESKPLNKCKDGVKCTDKEYSVNRRTEFRIVKM